MAKNTGAVKHTHQYHRMNGLWFCSGIDGCSHYMPKNMPEPVGRMSRCWKCEKEFQMLPINMKNDKPMCDECMESLSSVEDFIESFMGKPEEQEDIFTIRARKRKEEIEEIKRATLNSSSVESNTVHQSIDESEHTSDCAFVCFGMECDCKIGGM